MAATALIKFTQGLLIGTAGQALVGAVGTAVNVLNGNNADIQSWEIDLVYTPPSSAVAVAIPLAFDNNNDTPTASFTPDVRGSYRVMLRVWALPNRVGTPNIDIRDFIVKTAKRGLVLPPYQQDPAPLPTIASGLAGNKPNELNIGGQEFGWEGITGNGLLADLVDLIDSSTPLTKTLYVDAGAPGTFHDGAGTSAFTTFTAAATALTLGGTLLVTPADYSGESPVTYASGTTHALSVLNIAEHSVASAVTAVKLPTLTITGSANVFVRGCQLTLTSSAPVYAEDCILTAAGGGSASWNTVRGTLKGSAGNVTALDTTIDTSSSALSCASLSMMGGSFTTAGSLVSCSGTAVNLSNVSFPTGGISITFTGSAGTVTMDPISNIRFQAQGGTVTNGSIVVEQRSVQPAFPPLEITFSHSAGSVDVTSLPVPTNPTGTNRFRGTMFLVRQSEAIVGTGTVAIRVGTTTGGNDIITDQTVSSATALGASVAGEGPATLGSGLPATSFYSIALAAGDAFHMRATTTGSLTAGKATLYVYGVFLP